MIDMNNPVAMAQEIARLRAVNAELLAALKSAITIIDPYVDAATLTECRAAIARARDIIKS